MVDEFCQKDSNDIAKEIENIHAFFKLPIVPEYLTSEMLMSACYRALGYNGIKGTSTLKNSRDLHRMMYSAKGFTSGAFEKDEVEKLLKDVLLSPEDTTQKRSQKYPEYLFLAPIVPETALFSNPVRLTRNLNTKGGTPWNVDRLVKTLVAYCAKSEEDCKNIWNRMFELLSVAHDNEEDYFAQIVQRVLQDAADALRANIEDARDRLPRWDKQPNDTFDAKFNEFLESFSKLCQQTNDGANHVNVADFVQIFFAGIIVEILIAGYLIFRLVFFYFLIYIQYYIG